MAVAIRSALYLGINRNSGQSIMNIPEKTQTRVWWCLYTLEHMLGVMTGRPTCIQDCLSTSPLPKSFVNGKPQSSSTTQPIRGLNRTNEGLDQTSNGSGNILSQHVEEEVSNKSGNSHDAQSFDVMPTISNIWYLHYCDLTLIRQQIVNKVYSVDCVLEPWATIEDRIGEIKTKIEMWYKNLPELFVFIFKEDDDGGILRAKLHLAFHYYSAKIMLGRPCLCRHDTCQKSPSEKSSFGHRMAVEALQASTRMLDLIPDEPDAVRLYHQLPWWCILHYIMQAATVLLMELSFGCDHVPKDEMVFVRLAKKSIRWLYAMAEYSDSSHRAWQLCDGALRRLSTRIGYNISDMPPYPSLSPPDVPIDSHPVEPSQIQNLEPNFFYSVSVRGQHNSNGGGYTAVDLTHTLLGDANAMDSAYFPYDPISTEFMQAFSLHLPEEYLFHQD